MKGILLILVIIAALLAGPFLFLWAVSVVWDVNVQYDFWHWLAALLIGGGFLSSSRSKKD